jgi:7-keto-8-aminopelargonate synthetase-like enzyme
VIARHCDNKDLERKIRANMHYDRRFVITEGVFSMEGDIPDLRDIVNICKKYKNTFLIIDDCHGIGVIGKTGRGALELCGVEVNEIHLLVGTLSKGLGGGGGGYIAGKFEIIKYLNQRARSYIFSSTVGPSVVAVASYCIKYLD